MTKRRPVSPSDRWALTMLGHSSITVTLDRYGHLFPGLSDRLAEAVDANFREAQVGGREIAVGPKRG